MQPVFIAIISAACLVVTLLIATFSASYFVFKKVVGRRKPDTAVLEEPLPNTLMGENFPAMVKFYREQAAILTQKPSQKITVTTDDNLKLVGAYYKNEQPSDTTIICIHGYNSTGIGDFPAIANFYLANRFNVLIVDNRAHGASEGKYTGFGVLDRYDIIKWINYINDNIPNQKIVLHGMSMGASATLMASGLELPSNVKCIISDCGFTTPWAVFGLQIRQTYKIPSFPILELAEMYCKMIVKYDFHSVSATDCCKKSHTPTLFIHGANDMFVPCYMSKANYDACAATKKKLVLFENVGHTGSYFANPQKYQNEALDFIDKSMD